MVKYIKDILNDDICNNNECHITGLKAVYKLFLIEHNMKLLL